MSDKPLPLEGIRVLDVSQVMAGPFCCMLLGDLGADVIKVEPPSGDQTRSAMGFRLKGDDSLGFLNMNRNKRSIALDLKSDEDRRIFLELAKTADVIVENYPDVVRTRKLRLADYLRATRNCKLYDFERGIWTDYEGNPAGAPVRAAA